MVKLYNEIKLFLNERKRGTNTLEQSQIPNEHDKVNGKHLISR